MIPNVHGVGDVRRSGNYAAVPRAQPAPQFIPQSVPMQGNANPDGGAPPPGQQAVMMQQPGDGGPFHPKLGSILAPMFQKNSLIFVMLVLQVLMFVVSLVVGQFACDGAFVLGNPMAGPSGSTLALVGAKYVPAIQSGQVFRFITPVFLHGGILHLFFNGYFELVVGCRYEAEWGWKRMAAIYFLTGWGATLLSCLASPGSVSVGASGALFGILGAALSYVALNWTHMPDNKQRMCNLIFTIIINIVIGLGWTEGNIDNYAHLGGLISGVLVGILLVKPVGAALPGNYPVIRAVAVFLSVGYFVGMTAGTFFIPAIGGLSC